MIFINLVQQGIGDVGQGFVNFLLFCFLSDKFQARFKKLFKSYYFKICWKDKNSWLTQVDPSLSKPTKHSPAQPIRKEESETSPLLNGTKDVTSDKSPRPSPAWHGWGALLKEDIDQVAYFQPNVALKR